MFYEISRKYGLPVIGIAFGCGLLQLYDLTAILGLLGATMIFWSLLRH